MDNPKVSIILPSAYRHNKLDRCLRAIREADACVPYEILVGLIADDLDSQNVCAEQRVERVVLRDRAEYPGGAILSWNKLSQLARGEWLALFADDLIASPTWLVECLKATIQLGKPGLIGFNDLHSDGHVYASHFMAHRQFLLDYMGGCIFPPHYRSWWCDREISDIAMAAGRYVWAQDAIVEHRHYDWCPDVMDQTYTDSIPLHSQDELVYLNRRAAGFPKDYAPLLAEVQYA